MSKLWLLLVLLVLGFALLLFKNVLSVITADLLGIALLLVTLSSELKLFLKTFYLFGKDLLWNVEVVTIFLPGNLLHFVLARNCLHLFHYSLLDALLFRFHSSSDECWWIHLLAHIINLLTHFLEFLFGQLSNTSLLELLKPSSYSLITNKDSFANLAGWAC